LNVIEKITIQTPEGVPGPVVNLRGKPYGASGVKLEWEEPEEPNGIITGYQITYQQMEKYVVFFFNIA
jgi:hypothetical protein